MAQRLERRRAPRSPARIVAMVRIGRTEHSVATHDLSSRGVFVETGERAGERSLVKVCLSPPEGDAIELMAMAVWHLPAENAFRRPAGMGLQFYGVGRDQAQTLAKLIARAAREAASGAPPPTPPLRQHPRHAVALRMRPVDVQQLVELYTRDISAGGMFIEMAEPTLKAGDRVDFELIHPEVREGFRLPCTVRHVVPKGSDRPGLGLQFVGLDERVRRDLHAFVTQTVRELEVDELELVEDDDPKLA